MNTVFLIFCVFKLIGSNENRKVISGADTSSDKVYEKQYLNIGRVGFYAEYLGTTQRQNPRVLSENLLPLEKIPKFGTKVDLTPEEKQALLQESNLITTTFQTKASGTYDAMDENGNLYFNKTIARYNNGTIRHIYKHVGSIGLYYGDVSNDEPAIVKRITASYRNSSYHTSGLYAPPGEVISVRIREKDLKEIGELQVVIGQVLNSGISNNIWSERDFVRMPLLANNFVLTENTFPCTRDGTDYIFYVGSFLGGPVYFKSRTKTSSFTVTFKGAVREAHFIYGYTTPEEFSENWKSSAPCVDFDVWQNGITHTGPRKTMGTISTYKEFYDCGAYWEKVTSVSTSCPCDNFGKTAIIMLYEPFIAAGAAVSFVGNGATNCPSEWLSYVLDYNKYLQDGTGDTWGPHHEYNHQFQGSWGFTDDGETSNNLVTLISYSYFTKISQRRTEDGEPDGDGWNAYTSASWVLKDIVNNYHDYHLVAHAIMLHSFGQKLYLEAINMRLGRDNDQWYKSITNVTGLDFEYFFKNIYFNLSFSDNVINEFKKYNYKSYVPIACKYQTGVGYMIKGKRNEIHTMRPFSVPYNKPTVLNFAKNIIVPKGITYTIKSITNPPHGTLTRQSNTQYTYTPDPNYVSSGQITMTVGMTRNGVSNFPIDDVEIYLEFEQSKSLREKFKNAPRLDKKIYVYPEGSNPTNPVDAFLNNYEGSISMVDIVNNNTIQDSNTEIWMVHNTGEYNPDRMSELRGKFEVSAKKYRFALRGRVYAALFISLDGGQTYQLAANISNTDFSTDFKTDEEHPGYYHDYEFKEPQWVYFKAVLSHYGVSGAKTPFIGVGVGEIKEDGTAEINRLNSAHNEIYEKDPVFVAKSVFPRVWTEARTKITKEKGTLLDYFYYPWANEPKFNITHLFDDDDTNCIHSCSGGNHVSDEKPFSILADIGKVIEANTLSFYPPFEGNRHFMPKTFKLYGGEELENMQLIADITNAPKGNDNFVQVQFPTAKFRYYQLNVTNSHDDSGNRFVSYRYHQFSLDYKGFLVGIDDDRVTLYNSWNKKKNLCTFGQLYVGNGNSNSHAKAKFNFNGNSFAINAYKSPEYGSFDVYIDGEKVDSVNLNGDDKTVRMVYKKENLQEKNHEVVLDSTSTINVDSFMIGAALSTVHESVDDNEPPQVFNDDNWAAESNQSKPKKSKTGLIVGVVIAVIVVVAIAAVVAVIFIKKFRNGGAPHENSSDFLNAV